MHIGGGLQGDPGGAGALGQRGWGRPWPADGPLAIPLSRSESP